MTLRQNIHTVVAGKLCTGCGACTAVCAQNAIQMQETPGGLLQAHVNHDACNECGLCLKTCGGNHLHPGLLPEDVDPFTGPVLEAYCAYATDPAIRQQSQSGGVVTALLIHLLNTSQIQGAVVAEMPEDGSLRPRPLIATTPEQVHRAAGSKYCPIAVDAALPSLKERGQTNLAVVALPCHVHSLRNAQAAKVRWRQDVSLVIGLFCDRTMTYAAMEYLIAHSGCPREQAATFRFRRKTAGRWPGEGYVRAHDGREFTIPNRHRLACKDPFTPSYCRLCFDKLNVLSDLALGDAWGVREHHDGFSVVLARTQRGLDVLHAAAAAGVLHLEKIPAAQVFHGQALEKRRTSFAAYTQVWRAMNHAAPEFGIGPPWLGTPTAATVRTCRNLLRLAVTMAASPSPQAAVARARRYVRVTALHAALSPRGLARIAIRLLRRVRALKRPAGMKD